MHSTARKHANGPDIEPVDEVKAQLLESVQNLGQILESVQNLGQMVYKACPANPFLALFHRKLMSLTVKNLGNKQNLHRLGVDVTDIVETMPGGPADPNR